MIKEVNLKEVGQVESAIALMHLEIENARKENEVAIKLLHGYGSHGRGGVILTEARKELMYLKKRGQIKNFFSGDKWDISCQETIDILMKDKNLSNDCDLGHKNIGITIVEV